jgi:hypothetical protein
MKRHALLIVSLLLTCALLLSPMRAQAARQSQSASTIGGFVYHDLDEDGARDGGEPGIEGVEVRLTAFSGAVEITYTDARGLFLFEPESMGWYTLEEIDPPWYESTTRNILRVFFYPGYMGTSLFGDVARKVRGFQGVVYNDANRNRARDEGEGGVPDARVTLIDEQGNELSHVLTLADGEYAFEGLETGIYTLLETDPEGYFSTTPNQRSITLAEKDGLASANFGDFLLEDGELGPHDLELMEYFGVPLLDVLEMRDGQGWGYGEIARALYLAQLSSTPLTEILALRSSAEGWGEISKALLGEIGLKGFNLGRIISDGEDLAVGPQDANPADEAAAEGCELTTEDYLAMVAAHGQGLIKQACKLFRSQVPAGTRSPAEIITLLETRTYKEVKDMLNDPVVPYGAEISNSGGSGDDHPGNGDNGQGKSEAKGAKPGKAKKEDQPGC